MITPQDVRLQAQGHIYRGEGKPNEIGSDAYRLKQAQLTLESTKHIMDQVSRKLTEANGLLYSHRERLAMGHAGSKFADLEKPSDGLAMEELLSSTRYQIKIVDM